MRGRRGAARRGARALTFSPALGMARTLKKRSTTLLPHPAAKGVAPALAPVTSTARHTTSVPAKLAPTRATIALRRRGILSRVPRPGH